MKIYNTISQKLEEFKPQQDNIVKMYVCGITPYDETHLGHARCYVFFDVLRRYLKYKNYNVKFIQNFTDIDDKIIEKSRQLKVSINEVVEKYIVSYFETEKKLNIMPADFYPRVSHHIDDIILAIEKLIKKEIAYITPTGVYFNIEKFPEYGKLSKKKLNELISGIRIDVDETKRSVVDFALWKFTKTQDEPFWDSPWGKGRPGWHIECSVMSMKYLGETLDIHGGGQDLIFPHHENEIAQSESLTNKKFVNYWVHNGFVTINKQKMSKSLHNIFALKDLFQIFPPNVIRLFLISQHYQKPIDFSLQELQQYKSIIEKFSNFLDELELRIKNLSKSEPLNENLKTHIENIFKEFEYAMDDNINTSLALGAIHKLISFAFSFESENKFDYQYIYEKFLKMLNILGIELYREKEIPQDIMELVLQREIARKNKNYSLADQLRQKILNLGYVIEDTAYGPRIKKKF
ncbi:MAG: cysteine--tRNA ligase [Elusimicrobiota bacterium]|nr:cysteine--tRNA ligase [Endomicrobiia bacterium]MDW8165330.1 cysteine--tRNA ligase [Elusimicrobiota bacterium]